MSFSRTTKSWRLRWLSGRLCLACRPLRLTFKTRHIAEIENSFRCARIKAYLKALGPSSTPPLFLRWRSPSQVDRFRGASGPPHFHRLWADVLANAASTSTDDISLLLPLIKLITPYSKLNSQGAGIARQFQSGDCVLLKFAGEAAAFAGRLQFGQFSVIHRHIVLYLDSPLNSVHLRPAGPVPDAANAADENGDRPAGPVPAVNQCFDGL